MEKKKAFWVKYVIDARVEVDIDGDMTDDEVDCLIHDTIKDEICSHPEEYVVIDNIEEIKEER